MHQRTKKTIGFVVSHKENEKRRAILPADLQFIKNKSSLYFEKSYGNVLNIPDKAYTDLGCHIVSSEEALSQNIICEPKIGDAAYLNDLKKNQTIFGWIHAGQNPKTAQALASRHLNAYEWADMNDKNRHCFWKNNELAGEAAVIHAYQIAGFLPRDTKVAVLGRGNVAHGAVRVLTQLGAEVVSYSRTQEKLFREELGLYDVLVNAITWDTARTDHILYKNDLPRLKTGALIIDVSCDSHGAIETSHATTLNHPIYNIGGITHYVVDHTPSIFYKTASKDISAVVAKYLDDLVDGTPNAVLENAKISEYGIFNRQDLPIRKDFQVIMA